MNLNKLFKVYNKFLLPTIIFIVCAMVTFYGIIPGVKSIQNLYIEQKEIAKQVVAINNRIKILEGMDEASLKNHVTSLMTAVPPNKYLASVFVTLDAIALESGVTVDFMSITNGGNIATQSAELATVKDVSNLIPIKLDVNGTTDQIKTFLDNIISVRRLFRVDQFNMGFNSNSSSLSMNIDSFYAPLPKTLGKTDDPLTGFTANEEELLLKLNNYRLVSQDLTNYETLPPIIYGTKADPFKK
jgi:Tfp pilus assembly protein PilO